MKDQDQDKKLEAQLRKQLDQQADNLDAATLSRLRQARARAMQGAGKSATWYQRFNLNGLWAGGLTTAGVCALAVYLNVSQSPVIDEEFAPLITDTELLMGDDDIDFYDELEFYLWLESGDPDSGEV